MSTRVAVITGASSGIGLEAAKALAADGWRVIAVGRNPGRTAAAGEAIRAAAQGTAIDMLQADLARMGDVERLAHQIAGLTDRVDVLVNNAGGMTDRQVITPEGYEENFAGNHLGPFLLTKLLLPLLQRAAKDAPKGSVRIINTASDASEMIPAIDFSDIEGLENWSFGGAYCRSKLANVMHARALASRYAADGIVAHAVHPGVVGSNFITHASESTQAYMRTLQAQTPEQGSDTLIWLARDDEPGHSSGRYFYNQRNEKPPNPFAADEGNLDRLWTETEKLLARSGH